MIKIKVFTSEAGGKDAGEFLSKRLDSWIEKDGVEIISVQTDVGNVICAITVIYKDAVVPKFDDK